MNDLGNTDIVLVEDNPDDADMTLRAMRRADPVSQIRVARDGAEALALISARGHMPKLILLDLKLPKVDGFEVLQRVRSDPRTRLIPVVIFTSSREQRDVAEAYRLGVNSYVVKPMSFEAFAEAVGKMVKYWTLLNQPCQSIEAGGQP